MKTKERRGGAPAVGRIIAAAAWALLLGGCAGESPRSPLSQVQDPSLSLGIRERALVELVDQRLNEDATITVLGGLLQDERQPSALRRRAWRAASTHPDRSVSEEARRIGARLLPIEADRLMVAELCQAAGEGGWSEYAPALVRSLRRPVADVKDEDRPEYAALARLTPRGDVGAAAWEVFANPPRAPGVSAVDLAQRTRGDAWELLGRLDPSGARRGQWLDRAADENADETLKALGRVRRELGCVPVAGAELAWGTALADATRPGHRAWWASVAPRARAWGEPLRLRHLEPIRWAGEQRSAWLDEPREALVARVRSAWEGRAARVRSWGNRRPPYSEKLEDAMPRLERSDLVTLLVVDEALRSAGVLEALQRQARLDRADQTTEYGGVLEARGEGFEALLFPPRPGERRGDREFIASRDMVSASDHALAHYHFHAQERLNGAYAGPSEGDLEYARSSGRTCVVVTTLGEDELGADLLTPEGVVVDMGTFRAGGR